MEVKTRETFCGEEQELIFFFIRQTNLQWRHAFDIKRTGIAAILEIGDAIFWQNRFKIFEIT